jgi:hypothetical protein
MNRHLAHVAPPHKLDFIRWCYLSNKVDDRAKLALDISLIGFNTRS